MVTSMNHRAMKALGERIARQVSWNGGLDTLPIAV
jgi:hypothetical protein